jgi:hypothetical protein
MVTEAVTPNYTRAPSGRKRAVGNWGFGENVLVNHL